MQEAETDRSLVVVYRRETDHVAHFLVRTVDAVAGGVDDAVAVGVRGENCFPYFVGTVVADLFEDLRCQLFFFRRRGGSVGLEGRRCFERRFPSFAKEGVQLGILGRRSLRRRWRVS